MKPVAKADLDDSYLDASLKLTDQSLANLETEIERVQKLVNVDRATAERYAAISKKIDIEKLALEQLTKDLENCEGAKARAAELVIEREEAYHHVFEAVLNEQQVLLDLYEPLMTRLQRANGTLQKLAFSVRREADVEAWAGEGEELLDLRKQGAFKGQGKLLELANKAMKAAWETGNAAAVSAAMKKFREDNPPRSLRMLLSLSRVSPTTGNGRSGSPSGCTARHTCASATASTMTARTSASYRRVRAVSSCSCSILHSMTLTTDP